MKINPGYLKHLKVHYVLPIAFALGAGLPIASAYAADRPQANTRLVRDRDDRRGYYHGWRHYPRYGYNWRHRDWRPYGQYYYPGYYGYYGYYTPGYYPYTVPGYVVPAPGYYDYDWDWD